VHGLLALPSNCKEFLTRELIRFLSNQRVSWADDDIVVIGMASGQLPSSYPQTQVSSTSSLRRWTAHKLLLSGKITQVVVTEKEKHQLQGLWPCPQQSLKTKLCKSNRSALSKVWRALQICWMHCRCAQKSINLLHIVAYGSRYTILYVKYTSTSAIGETSLSYRNGRSEVTISMFCKHVNQTFNIKPWLRNWV
jgi:hypothetical protein